MNTMHLSKLGALLFAAWGVLHVIGAAAMFMQGYHVYDPNYSASAPLADAALKYLAYFILLIGLAVTAVSIRLNLRNSHVGLALNTALIGLTDLGLVLFLVVPGFVSWGEAALGLGLFGAALIPATIACRRAM